MPEKIQKRPGWGMKSLSLFLTIIFLIPLIYGFYSVIQNAFVTNDISSSIGYILVLVIVVPVFFILIKWSVHIREVTYKEFKKESAPRSQETKRMVFLLRKSPLAIAGLIMIGTLVVLAMLAPVIAPEHWDPRYAEIPNAQPYFRLAGPSLSVAQQYDLYAEHIYSLYPRDNAIDIGMDSSGNGFLVANAVLPYGIYKPSSGWSNVTSVTVVPQSAILDRVSITPIVEHIPVGDSTKFTAHATSTDGKEMDAAFAWDVAGGIGDLMSKYGRTVEFFASNSSASGSLHVTAEYNSVVKETSIPIQVVPVPDAWSVSSTSIRAASSIALVNYPKRIAVDAFAANGSTVPSSQYNVSWKIEYQTGTNEDLYSISMPTTKRGIAVGKNGTVLRTTDGGSIWIPLSSPDTSISLNDVSFVNALEGWVVGGSGAIFSTNTGGDAWTKQNSTVKGDLYGVCFTNQKLGWAVGENGTVLNTSDGGANWTLQTTGTNIAIRSIAFAGGIGLAVGDSGIVLRTTDGGANWSQIPSGASTSLTKAFIANQNVSYISGSAGTVLKSSDGGASWTKINANTSVDLHGIYFFTEDFGLVSGANGLLTRTTSGGSEWEVQTTNTTATLYSISSQRKTEETTFIVGSGGTILKKMGADWIQTKTTISKMFGNETEMVSGTPGEVRLSATIKTQNGTSVLYSRIYVMDSFIILSNKIDATPSQVTIKRGELLSVNVTVRDEFGDIVTDSTLAWRVSGSISKLNENEASIRGESPSPTERLTVNNARTGFWAARIVNRGAIGPFYIRVIGFYESYDAKNSTYDQVNVFILSDGENMDGNPIQQDDTRTYSFNLTDSLSELHLDLIGPKSHLFGTDENGRDYASLILYGTGISMRIAIIVVVSALLIGTLLGGVSGYFGGKMDEILMRVTDVFLSIPGLILAMGVAAVLGRSLDNIMYALIIVWWPGYTRLVRGQALSVRENLYVEAARAVGASETRIIIKHVIPNCLSAVLVNATLDIGAAVLVAAGLSFIGFGALYPVPELGLLISTGRNRVFTAPWLVTLPGVAIFVFVLGFNLFGDGLRDLLDPRLRE